MQTRQQTLNNWLASFFPRDSFHLSLLKGDASFRRYYRLQTNTQSFIVMDAPPEREALGPFLSMQSILYHANLPVPLCLEKNISDGFLLLSDFGDTLLLERLLSRTCPEARRLPLDLLAKLQQISPPDHLPCFDRGHIQEEFHIFTHWFLETYLQLSLSESEQDLLNSVLERLIQMIEVQPTVLIHRDYHSRNIMWLKDATLGLIDFQDAMLGPIGYDMVSLLKDCYIAWSVEELNEAYTYYHAAHLSRTHPTLSLPMFRQFVDICGLQRHLKVLGIFSRLALRDQKLTYLDDLPLTLNYVMSYLKNEPTFKDFYQFMQTRVTLPATTAVLYNHSL